MTLMAAVLAAAVTFPVTPTTRITVDVGAGDVRVMGAARADVEVRAERATASADGDRIVIRSEDADGPLNRQARATVNLSVPPTVVIESIRIVDGSLTLEGVTGTVGADVRQGSIRAANVAGVMRLETGFGDVIVDGARLVADGLLRLRAFNGDVRLTLASRPDHARVLALTFNGTIETDLPLTRRESFGPKFAEGTFGRGEPLISIDSVTGNVSITVAPSPRQ